MWIYPNTSSGVWNHLWPLHKPKSSTNEPLQSFLHEIRSSLTCLERLSVQWWCHRATLGDVHGCCSRSAGPLWSWGYHQTLPIAKHLRHCEQSARTRWRKTIWIMSSWRFAVLKQSVDRKLYLLQHHLYPKPSSLLSVLRRRKRRAGQGCTRHRIKHPIEIWRNTTINYTMWHGHSSDVLNVPILTIFISRECTRLGLLFRMSHIFTCLSADAVTRHPLIWLLTSSPGENMILLWPLVISLGDKMNHQVICSSQMH